MRTRRRKQRFTWLPTIGTASGTEQGSDNLSGRSFSIPVEPDGSTNVVITPLTFDKPFEGDELTSAATPLGTVLGNEYFLKRIVGKCFASMLTANNLNGDPSTVESAFFAAGFFIARANDFDAGGGADTPIGSATPAERREHYNPLGEDCIREPWIWRRVWALSNRAKYFSHEVRASVSFTPFNAGQAFWPSSTAEYGSVADGPHIDAKTARRIKQDERLWFVIATQMDPNIDPPQQGGVIAGYLDFRLLGALRKARQGSSF